jgi:uncharacterized protein (DUF433 family)
MGSTSRLKVIFGGVLGAAIAVRARKDIGISLEQAIAHSYIYPTVRPESIVGRLSLTDSVCRILKQGAQIMASLDWSQCPAVESVPGRRSGAWVFSGTRMPVATVFENLEAGSDIEEIVEQFHVTREQIQAVLEFAARSLDAPPVPQTVLAPAADAHPL